MDQLPGSPSIRGAGVAAAAGDLLVTLRRGWLDVAETTLPDDRLLPELIGERLRALSSEGVVPTETELLDIAEEAAQHAVSSGSADAARQLSKRMRRAIYEYLLTVDAVLAGGGPPAPAPATPADDALNTSAWHSNRNDGRPELIWDEPALHVLEGGVTLHTPAEAASVENQGAAAPEAEHAEAQAPAEADEVDDLEAVSPHVEDEGDDEVDDLEAVAAPVDGEQADEADELEAAVPDVEEEEADAVDDLEAEAPEVEDEQADMVDTDIDAMPEDVEDDEIDEFETADADADVEDETEAEFVPFELSEPESRDQPEDPAATPAPPRSAEDAPRLVVVELDRAQALPPEVQRAAAARLAAVAQEAARVPERFRRGSLVSRLEAASASESAPLVVPSYRAWADVLASGAAFTLDAQPARRSRTEAAHDGEPSVDEAVPTTEPDDADDDGAPEDAGIQPVPVDEVGPLEASTDQEPAETARWAFPPPTQIARPTADAWALPNGGDSDTEASSPWLPTRVAPAADQHGWLPSAGGLQVHQAESDDAAGASDPVESTTPDPTADGDGHDNAWSVRRSPRQQALQHHLAQRRRDDVIRAAATAFEESASARPRRDRLPDIAVSHLPEQIAELLRRKRTGEAAALVQRAAQEIGGREIADLALNCGDRCRDRHQARAAVNSYLAAWRADPVYEVPLWRLAETCLADNETELAVGYLERIADLMRARGDDDGALDTYRKLIAVSPDRGDIRALLQTAQSLGRFPD